MPNDNPHPIDLSNPSLPDAADLALPPESARPVLGSGYSSESIYGRADTRGSLGDDFKWPESGPSRIPASERVASGSVSAFDPRAEGMHVEGKGRGREQRKGSGAQDGMKEAEADDNGDGNDPKLGPFGAKLVAAMTGASVTSLLMTPFDVLKTRLQTVQPDPYHTSPPPAPSSECCQTSLLTPRPGSGPLNSTGRNSVSSFASSSSSSAAASATGAATSSTHKKNPFTCFTSVDEVPISRYAKSARAKFSSLTAASSSSSMGSTVMTIPAPAPRGCSFPSKWAGIWGEAVTLEEALRRARVSAGAGAGAGAGMGGGGLYSTLVLPRDKAGFWSEIATIRNEVGVRGLWKGVGTTLTMSIPSSAIYMIGYEYLLERISPLFSDSSDPNAHISALHRPMPSRASTSESMPGTAGSLAASTPTTASLTPAPLLAGSLARTMAATVISPIEMFRTRLQALPANGVSPTYASTFKDMGGLVKSKGATILWRGLGPTLWRDVPFSGIYWAGFEILKTRFSTTTSLSPLTTSFLSGAISGTVSALVTQPFDVLKTRRQVFTPSPDCAPAALKHRASTLPLAMHVIKTEGWGALFAGTVPRCGKVAPACGLMIACYEGVGRYLGGK